ncbi:MAG: ATP-binding cassette domain-containing protein [Pirellulaceae bacterium]|nr:ATP-binding cassette domain-containing protein [Pirellulaceae bacterium]
MNQTALEIRDVSHWYGKNRVLHNVNLQIAAGQIVAVVGPSGCGKSTLLRAILGTHPPAAGEIIANGHAITEPTRDVGIVFQNYSLYEFLSARDNVSFGLKLDQTSFAARIFGFPSYLRKRHEHQKEAEAFLDKVGLRQAALLFPGQMSGGMRQRVALAQALILKPKIVLLDEPFGALDESMREELQVMLLRFYQANLLAKKAGLVPEYTILIVTHELNEAIYVSDRVIGMSRYHSEGHLGASIVYDRPSPIFHPEDPRDFSKFIEQREELRRAVFDPEYIKDRNKYVTFWNDLATLSNEMNQDDPS